MPTYSYFCPRCGATREITTASMRNGPPSDFCRECIDSHPTAMMLKRDYRTDRPRIAAVPQAVYSPSAGREFSDDRQVDEHIKHLTAAHEERHGYTPNIVKRHPSEVNPVEGGEEVYRAARDRGEISSRVTHH